MNGTPPPVSGIQPKNSGLAIWSLVLGILGLVLLLVCVGPLFAIPGVICGHLAHSRIKRSGGMLTGGGLALGGLITGYITIALGVFLIPLMAAIAIPNFVKARDIAMRNQCVNNLRQIDTAKQQWALDNQKDAAMIPTTDELDAVLKEVKMADFKCLKQGAYTINPVNESPTCSIPGHSLSPAESSQ